METLLGLPVEVLSSIAVYLHPHQLHVLKRLAKNASAKLLLPSSFAFAHRNMLILAQDPSFKWRNVAWDKLGHNYMAAVVSIFGVSYFSLSIFGVDYEESTAVDLNSSASASLIPAALVLAAHHDTQYLRRIKKPINWSMCDSLSVQIAAISGWTHVLKAILSTSPSISSEYTDFALDLAAQNGYLELVNYLLTFPSVDLAHENSSAFRHACMNGHYEVAKALVFHNHTQREESSLNPQACDNFALVKASQHGHSRIVSLLLQTYPELDPMAFEARALQVAIESGHANVVEVIVNDWRMDIKLLKKEYQDVLNPFVEYLAEKRRADESTIACMVPC